MQQIENTSQLRIIVVAVNEIAGGFETTGPFTEFTSFRFVTFNLTLTHSGLSEDRHYTDWASLLDGWSDIRREAPNKITVNLAAADWIDFSVKCKKIKNVTVRLICRFRITTLEDHYLCRLCVLLGGLSSPLIGFPDSSPRHMLWVSASWVDL